MELAQNKISLKSSNPQSDIIRYIYALAPILGGGGNAPLYLALCQTYESHSKKSARSANPYKSFCFVWLLPKVDSLYPLDSNPQSKVALIYSYVIDFICSLKSRDLDTSLRINATLSMTRWGVDSHIWDCFVLAMQGLAMTIQCVPSRYCEKMSVANFRGNPLPTPLSRVSKCKLKS